MNTARFEPLQSIGTLAVVGASHPVGREFLELLDENRVSIPTLKRFAATDRLDEVGDEPLGDEEEALELLTADSFEGVEVAFFCAGPDVARRFAPIAAKAGCLVVDGSGAFGADHAVPLVVPQVNGARLRDFQGTLIANPTVGATPLALVLKPLHDRFGIRRVVVATYQSASEAGRDGYARLSRQTAELLNGQDVWSESAADGAPHPFAFNCLPFVGEPGPDGSSSEERRTAAELARILDLPGLRCAVTAVRVPTFVGFGAAVNVELEKPVEAMAEVRELLDGFNGIKVLDNPGAHIYPTNRECVGSDYAFVGRLRQDPSVPSGLGFWLMTDNLRKGAALNALECLETLYNYRRMS